MGAYSAYMTQDSTCPSPRAQVTLDQSINFVTRLRLSLGPYKTWLVDDPQVVTQTRPSLVYIKEISIPFYITL